ncbi:MAG: fluoride efflux transporter CrcB [Bacteroidota bacterium]
MKELLYVSAGSFLGGGLRYLLSQFIQDKTLSSFPFGTLGVNLLGCFLIGLVLGFSERGNVSTEWRLFLATGILGGFTTFSAFSFEAISLFRNGMMGYAVIYICGSIMIGLVATLIGLSLVKFL